jgi:hypothetical protein
MCAASISAQTKMLPAVTPRSLRAHCHLVLGRGLSTTTSATTTSATASSSSSSAAAASSSSSSPSPWSLCYVVFSIEAQSVSLSFPASPFQISMTKGARGRNGSSPLSALYQGSSPSGLTCA